MPRRNRKAAGRRRRRARKRSANATSVQMPSQIVPDRVRTKLVYADRLPLVFTAGNLATNVFRGNSVYDPDMTGTGHQPQGFDQWAAFYNRYKVYASRIEVEPLTVGTTAAAQSGYVAVIPTNAPTAYSGTDMDSIMEAPYCKHKHYYIARPIKINNYISTEKIIGLNKKAVEVENDLSALTSTNPVMDWFWQVYMDSADESTGQTVHCRFRITYYVEFYDRKELDQS